MLHRYDGKRFYNLDFVNVKGKLTKFLKWQITKKTKPWPVWIETQQAQNIADRVYGSDLVVTFINHSTVLIQTQGLNIITDPVYSYRVSPFQWLGPKRIKDPGIKFEKLPHIDIILISHDHYDHLDIRTLKKLHLNFEPKIYAGLKINKILSSHKIKLNCQEMGWWEKHEINDDVAIHFLPAKHWSGRYGFYKNNFSLWGSFAIETSSGNIYFAGDSGYSDHFKIIQKKFKEFRLSLLPIGAYEPRWFLKEFHINPSEAVLAHQDLQSKNSMAIHFGTFRLSDEDYNQPNLDLHKALDHHNISHNNFKMIREGDSWKIPVN